MQYQPKTYYIKTLGCQANIADSNSMAGILEALGFEAVTSTTSYANEREELLDLLPQTDLFILNTCSVRQKSEDKAYGVGKHFAELRRLGKKIPFAVMSGCMVGSVTGARARYAFEELEKKTQWVDLYMNPSQVFDLPNLLLEKGVLDEWAVKKFNSAGSLAVQPTPGHAFVNISFGCDNFCTFCVVPYARGEEKSRPEKDILFEIAHLAKRGFNHITLCGQNVNSWGLSMSEKFEIRTGSDQKLPFADLLRKVHNVEGVEKIDFISSNPFDFTQDLIDALQLPKVSNYLHMAVQSGNNNVLKRMNRRHTVEEFLSLVDKIKAAKENTEFGTDIIVGFPGETREEFMDTARLFEKVKFNVAYISMYSPRKGTPAEKFFKDDVPREEKKWRHEYLTNVWKSALT
ncbi:MiaB/RimO family radical SAM methylthiotransferase [Patescibacteria group bacterium]|nr:MiaB/RimO family radical SAM methylthiotransferase [Patescibacteria group bacterium]